jgi:biotin synthase
MININTISDLLDKTRFSKADIITLLSLEDPEQKKMLYRKALNTKLDFLGNKVYYRGLVEFSNICSKNCYYCGIRRDNKNTSRYTVTDEEVLQAVRYVQKERFGSIVLQSGEISSQQFTNRITALLHRIKEISDGKVGVTLSMGEQSPDVYREWFEAGAHRYLLRIEESNRELYKKLHPNDKNHNYDKRLSALESLRTIGYQVGTGVMIGLPFQTVSDLADDLLFMQEFDVDMVGMGPYIEHHDTPMYEFRHSLMTRRERFELTLKMIAILRILMKDINIASTTALQAIDPLGREKGLQVGANIIMPNITPGKYRENYLLYDDKPCVDENPDDCKDCLEKRINFVEHEVAYDEWGDSKHYFRRMNKVAD